MNRSAGAKPAWSSLRSTPRTSPTVLPSSTVVLASIISRRMSLAIVWYRSGETFWAGKGAGSIRTAAAVTKARFLMERLR